MSNGSSKNEVDSRQMEMSEYVNPIFAPTVAPTDTEMTIAPAQQRHVVYCRNNHPLVLNTELRFRTGRWRCDNVCSAVGCSGGHIDIPRVKKCDRYRCMTCDFDMCPTCYEKFAVSGEPTPPKVYHSRYTLWEKMRGFVIAFGLSCVFLCIIMIIQATAPDCPNKRTTSSNITSAALFGNVSNDTNITDDDGDEICCSPNMFGRSIDVGCSDGSGGFSSSGCFVPHTMVYLQDKSLRAFEDIELGDVMFDGGYVEAIMKVYGEDESLYDIDGVVVSGSHAVKDPFDMVWKRAREVSVYDKVEYSEPLLWNVVTTTHHIHLPTNNLNHQHMLVAADYMEVDETDEMLDGSVLFLNKRYQSETASLTDVLAIPAATAAATTVVSTNGMSSLFPQHSAEKTQLRHLVSCFPPATLVMLHDGSLVRIDKLEPGIKLYHQSFNVENMVTATMRMIGEHEVLYNVNGLVISSLHTMKDPSDNMTWRHAKDIKTAERLDGLVEPVLYNLITTQHSFFVVVPKDARTGERYQEETFEVADFLELEEHDELLEWNIAQLNKRETGLM